MGKSDSSKNKGLALAGNEQEESECDEVEAAKLVRWFKKFFRNNRYANQRNNKQRRSTNSKSIFECHKCGSIDHFIKDFLIWKNEKGKGKARKTGRLPMKEDLNKTDFRKARIVAWGESESEDETEIPEEEETTNLCLMASHDSKNEKSKGKEVMTFNSFPNHQFNLDKYKLIQLVMETQDKLEESNDKCLQIRKDLKISKDHVFYLNTFRSDVQNRFFNLLDQNIILKETLERVKKENIIFNVELTLYKLLGLNKDLNNTSMHDFCTDFQKLKIDLESNKAENENLQLELNSRGKGKIKNVPKWILDASTKRTEGLGYNKNNKKKKVYVDLPSIKVCTFCGKTRHLKIQCAKREQHDNSNKIYVDHIFGLRNMTHVKSTRNPRKTGFLILTNNLFCSSSEEEQLIVSRQWLLQA